MGFGGQVTEERSFRAIVVGATGLVGAALVQLLFDEPSCAGVTTLVRRDSGRNHPKLREHVVDFDRPQAWADWVRGDVLFSALGTTLEKAGSQAAQYRVDHTYQLSVATAAAENGVPSYVLVSAMGADPSSRLFYSRMKGELERDVGALAFRRITLLRPGILAGERAEVRRGERAALAVLRFVPRWPALASLRPIGADVVARAALVAGRAPEPGLHTWGPAALFAAGDPGAAG